MPHPARESEFEERLLEEIYACRTMEAVEASVACAAFLSREGVTPDNYGAFRRMLEIDNHWVIGALVGEHDPFHLFSAVKPDNSIIDRILLMMSRSQKGGIYPKKLAVGVGVLQSVYNSPSDGYRTHPITLADASNIGKHLDKKKGQDDPLNRAILEVLEKLAALEATGDAVMKRLAAHASAIRLAFLDATKSLEGIIPAVLQARAPGRSEVAPRWDTAALRDTSLELRFSELAERWRTDTAACSSTTEMATHPAYQEIIGMGPAVVPLILAELEREPDHWFWALKAIAGIDPVPVKDQGNLPRMADAWLRWGRDHRALVGGEGGVRDDVAAPSGTSGAYRT